MSKIHFFAALFGIVMLGSVQAYEAKSIIKSSVVITKHDTKKLISNALTAKKEVYLINLELTPEQKRMVLTYNPKHTIQMDTNNSLLPSKVFIGMNGVPVLDQGKYGTCVTFANTAALDVLLGRGDYISQLCSLELGQYLHDRGVKLLLHSGWWGSSGGAVLNQLMSFGFINKFNQRTNSCGGLTEYPIDGTDPDSTSMTLDEFQSIHEDLFDLYSDKKVQWDSLLTYSQRFSLNPANPMPPYDGNKILLQIKDFFAKVAEKSKDPIGIVTFGVMLPYQYCSAGACARYHEKDDTWAITKAIANIDPDSERFNLAGHEMIIMGYDDTAVAIDNDGNRHQGLLFLRNSFGDDIGDHGNNYMTYDFFEKFADEVQIIYKPDFKIPQ